MAYRTRLGTDQTLTVEQRGEQTLIRLAGEGQSQSSSVQTGTWTHPPRLYRLEGELLLEIRGDPAAYYRLEGSQLHSLQRAPELEDAEELGLEEVPDGREDSGMEPMKKMEPMKPMKPM